MATREFWQRRGTSTKQPGPAPRRMTAIGTRGGHTKVCAVSGCLIGSLLPASCARQNSVQGSGGKLVFNESIEPILSENCYQCHGPDPGSRKAGLRLDRPEFAFAPHEKSGPAIVKGDASGSPLIQRIESNDDKQRMPPPEAHRTLNAAQ